APPLRVAFDRRLELEFHGTRITSDGGLLAYRELDDALDLTTTGMSALAEGRRGRNTRHRLLGLLRQALYGRLAGYEDVNDAERLAHDPVMRAIVGREGLNRPAASTSQMGRFETEWLATEANLDALTDLSGAWIDRVHRRRPPDGIILDLDSSESPTYGEQEGSAWNGHFRCTCYHPLFLFNQFGDPERCMLRPGNVHTAEGWRSVLAPVIARYRQQGGLELYFRGDAGFAKPEVYEMLEAEEVGYAIRLPANAVLQERIGHLLTRPVGRPPKKPQVFFASFRYQARSWTKPRRVVAKIEWHQGELYPRVGFIVTNLKRPAERVVRFYNGRGTAEQWVKEGKQALRWTRLSCRAFRDNAVRLQLFALAYNLANFLRSLVLPTEVAQWSLSTLRERLVKIGARIVRHGRYVVFQLAEVAVPRALFAAILCRIDRLRGPPMVAA
ncbi:MAG TPA: IS1380 family transposase, partial [Geminicoccaceae bacterium]|nr:IS1380 family transposase [Geminicoccaceae bacterium]